MSNLYDVIIIGSGPAGLTAAIYTTRANLKTLIIAGLTWGGQLMLTSTVENFPGFPEGIEGPELMNRMRKQAERFGAVIVDSNFVSGKFVKPPFKVKTDDNEYIGRSIIIATGADTKWLGVPGEKELIGRGISSCAPCDGPFFKDKNIIVAGGGDSAMEEAYVLTRFAKSVVLIHRRDSFRASPIMVERAKKNPKIRFLMNTQIQRILGENKVEKVILRSKIKDQRSKPKLKAKNFDDMVTIKEFNGKRLEIQGSEIIWEMPIEGIFVAIGHKPNSQIFEGIERDKEGYIIVQKHMKTNIDGVFVAGDVHDRSYRQGITAAGLGCSAALEAQWWLEKMR